MGDSTFRAADTNTGPRVYGSRVSRDRHAAYEHALNETGCCSECMGAERGDSGDAEYRYVVGHVEAQMYSVMSSVLDYTWLFKDTQSQGPRPRTTPACD